MKNDLKTRLHRLLDGHWRSGLAQNAINWFMVALILINVVAVVLHSVEAISHGREHIFQAVELASVILFAIEYVLRVWTCTRDPSDRYRKRYIGRIRYLFTPMAIVDFLAFAPYFLALFVDMTQDHLDALRVPLMLKMTRYSPALAMLGAVVFEERKALFSVSVLMGVMLVFASSAMYLIEHDQHPDDAFGSIPESMWWGMATLTTVGYGDVTPSTPAGKVLGTFIAVLGIGMFAMPAAILATAFAREMRRRDFIVSWNVVAKVPLFANLNAEQIANIVSLLQPRQAAPDEVIFHQGDPGDAVYFVSEGHLEASAPTGVFHIDTGQFFGEIALIQKGERTATVTARSTCRLLMLDCDDFERLLRDDEQIRATVERVMRERLEELARAKTDG